jgi:4-amino-4-deoxy-L-arabinose transferase-like glycosyltransferase
LASSLRSPVFFLILAVYLLVGTLFATLTPNWQAPDEPAHYNYVRYLARQDHFPKLTTGCYNQAYLSQLTSRRFPPDLPIDSLCYEFHQPPLYYLLATPIFLLTEGSLTALRLLSVILGAGVVTFAFLVGQTIFPNPKGIAYGTMALVAFVPMHVAILASVNNDALAELILAALLLQLTRRLMTPPQAAGRSDIGLGVLLGLGLITKLAVYIAVPLVAMTLWLAARKEATRSGRGDGWIEWRRLTQQAAIIYGLALVIALPWYMRNITLYGDFDLLGLARHDEVVVGQLRMAEKLAEVGWRAYVGDFFITTFHSFWGQFGWMAVPMSGRAYLALTLLTLATLGGLVGFWISLGVPSADFGFGKDISSPHPSGNRAKPPCGTQHILSSAQRHALALMALTIGLTALGYGWYNLEFVQFQGRYLFPALIPLGLFTTLGLYEALSWQWRWWLVAGLALALGWVVVTGWSSGNLDKWAVLIVGLMLALAIGRIWLARRWLIPTAGMMAAIYAGLALLTLISPFWYVIPYLSP